MNKFKFFRSVSVCVAGLALGIATPALISAASSANIVNIYCYEDLEEMRTDPKGSYRLMCDIDFTGKEWEPLVFSGNFDGNGHAFLNMNIDSFTEETRKSYDGNMIDYDTNYSGVFGILENASVSDLTVAGINIDITTEKECFIGGIAGFMDNSTIKNCSVEGTLKLTTDDKSFGVGGIAGFGNGSIEKTKADMTLICVDTNVEYKEEQFMGGAYAAGYIDLIGNNVKIDGYDSDHGYVHDGGLVGMYILYPAGTDYAGFINENTITGAIHFFEDNVDRRAYCSDCVGEVMNWTYEFNGNIPDFTRDEVFDYSKDLYPHADCAGAAQMSSEVVSGSCDSIGYTKHTCPECGYETKDSYTGFKHAVNNYTELPEAERTDIVVEEGSCSLCDKDLYQVSEAKPADIEVQTSEAESTQEVTDSENKGIPQALIILIVVVVVVVALLVTVLAIRNHNIKKRRKRRRKRQHR